MSQVEFYYDLVSPYSYLAYGRVNQICEEHGAELVLRPMLLGAVHKAVGTFLKHAGRRDPDGLRRFLDAHEPDMARAAVRLAVAGLDPGDRAPYVG